MDSLPALGREIWEVIQPTEALYAPLLRAKEAEIRSTPCEEHSYGPHDRQTLDVYYPAGTTTTTTTTPSPSSSRPRVLVFFHGGGFVVNSKRNPAFADGLTFANLGHFFAARHGFVVVVANYRRFDHAARYPSGGEDVELVLRWVAETLPRQRPGRLAAPDVFLVGNSAGGVHVATWALDPAFAPSRARLTGEAAADGPRLRGLVLFSVPAHYKTALPHRMEPVVAYYGPNGAAEAHAPLGLLEAARRRGDPAPLPGAGVLLLTDELDPDDEIMGSNRDFAAAWPWAAPALQRVTIPGHNHISPVFALATGIEREERWGDELARWCEACLEA